MAQGIIGLPASHLMAFMYDNIQIILTGLYGASNFLKWYLYQPLLYPTLYPSIYLYLMPTTMPTFQTPKTYLHKILTKLLKIILKKFLKKKSQNVLQIKIYFLSLYCNQKAILDILKQYKINLFLFSFSYKSFSFIEKRI